MVAGLTRLMTFAGLLFEGIALYVDHLIRNKTVCNLKIKTKAVFTSCMRFPQGLDVKIHKTDNI